MVNYLITLLFGLPISLSLTIFAALIALVLSFIFTIIINLYIPVLSQIIIGYIFLFTGTPLLVQIFLIYYGFGKLIYLRNIHWILDFLSHPWLCALLALSLNSAAYSTQLFNGIIHVIPLSQWQSCLALGMNRIQSLRLLMSFAIRRAFSSYSNEVIMIFKSTSLVHTITLMDIMGYSQFLYGQTYDIMVFGTAGIIYLCINSALTILMRILEKYILRFECHNK